MSTSQSNFRAELDSARVLVLGCGVSGVSAACFAARCGATVRVADTRSEPPQAQRLAENCPQASLIVGEFSPALLDGITHLVVSPGIDLREPLIRAAGEHGLEIVGDIEWFARVVDAPVIAITGSNGKSTVTAWLGEIVRRAGLRVAVGGNFGTPALDLLDDDIELYVLELSSFQLELTRALAVRAGAVLNVSADHIDRHGDIDTYAALKARVVAHADVAVLNADDARVRRMATANAVVRRFGTAADAGYRLIETQAGTALARETRAWLRCDALRLAGRHNQLNALAVWALAEAAGLDEAVIREGLKQFAGLPHRCQRVAEIEGVRWINDSKGTNLGALLASLEGMDAPVVLIAGGQAKGADFAALGPAAAKHARAVVVFGIDRELICRAVEGYVPVYRVHTLHEAVQRAAMLAERGDTVLFSPGCASFDQFDDYQHRGECFIAEVRGLAA